MRLALSLILAMTGACPALAARSDDLADLARALGKSQAVREACEGGSDQHWRSQYMRLMDLEKPDEAAAAQVRAAFGAGYAQAKAEFADCSPEARAAASAAANEGRVLADRLAGPPPAPAASLDPLAEAPPPR